MGGGLIQNSSRFMQIHLQNSSTYSPPKGGLCFELINQRGAESGFHQLDGGLLLFFFILPNRIKIKPDFILVSFSNVFISKKVYFLKICLNLVAQTKSVKNILLPVHCSGFFVTYRISSYKARGYYYFTQPSNVNFIRKYYISTT